MGIEPADRGVGHPIPTGMVAFLFSDIEGSTAHWEARAQAMQIALRRHDQMLRAAIEQRDGYVFKTVGDEFCAAFSAIENALAAAIEAQRTLNAEDWSAVDGLRVRMAIHAGQTDERDGDYYGPVVNRIARILATAHGGQIIVSEAVADVAKHRLPPQSSLRALGSHRLRDLARPEEIYQLSVPDLQSDFPPLRSLETVSNNLPVQLTSFVGRASELAEIKGLVARSHLVTLVGAGGIGKTRTVLQVAADLLDDFPDGAWLVELAPIVDGDLVPSAIASVFNIDDAGEARTTIANLILKLKEKKALVILDNCEQVVGAAAAAAEQILTRCAQIKLLATSREPLGIAGEESYRLPSLVVPARDDELSLENAMAYSAVALFAERAHSAKNDFALTESNVTIVADIVRRLDGIALAIELAAPRVKVLSIGQLAQRLDERFKLLTGGSRTALPRQQTLRAMIDWSYELLSEAERSLLRRLSIFRGGCRLEAVNDVCSGDRFPDFDGLELLSALVDKSLVTSESEGTHQRYGLFESTRAYLLEKARELVELQALSRRHAEFFTRVAEEAETSLGSSPPTIEWCNTVGLELENFRAALDWAFETNGAIELGVRMLTALRQFWQLRGLSAEAVRRAERALQFEAELPRPLQAMLWFALAYWRGELKAPRQQLEPAARACKLYEELGNKPQLARALRLRGIARLRLGEYVPAQEDFERAIQLFQDLGDRHGITGAMFSMAGTLTVSGRLEEAVVLNKQLLELFRDLGDEWGIRSARCNLAEVEFELGDVASAIRRARENLESESLRIDPVFRSNQQNNLAAYLLALDERDGARSSALQALNSAREVETQHFTALALQHLAAVLAERDPRRAAQMLGYVEKVFTADGYTREFPERFTYDRLMGALRNALDDEQINALGNEGARLSTEQVIELARASAT